MMGRKSFDLIIMLPRDKKPKRDISAASFKIWPMEAS
jgi:hypothetical protein